MREYSLLFLIVGCLGQNLPVGTQSGSSGQGGLNGGQVGGLTGGQTGALPTGGLPTGGLPTGGLPTGGLPTGGLPTGGLPTGGLPTGGLPTGGTPGLPTDQQPNTGGTGGTPSPITLPNLNVTGPQNVNRPCRRYDIHCVRYFFKNHAQCKQPLGKVPEPFYRAISNQVYPAFNLTVTNTNAYYLGFNTGRIEDFYVNRETDKVVISILFDRLIKSSKDVIIRYHRRAREPIITYGYSTLGFRSLLITATIPQVDKLRLDRADVFGYANELPTLDIDPRLGESSDPVVAKAFAAFLADIKTVTTENLFTEAAYFAAVFIQHVICDFGLKLI